MDTDEPTIHYDRERHETQHPPGETAPIPVSRDATQSPTCPDMFPIPERMTALHLLLEECEVLWEVARHPRTDALWPRYRAGLKQHERMLAEYLRLVRFYLGEQ